MSDVIKDSKRMELICEYLKTGKQPEGFKIIETKNGKYRLTRLRQGKAALEAKRAKLQKNIEDIDAELKKLEPEPQPDAPHRVLSERASAHEQDNV